MEAASLASNIWGALQLLRTKVHARGNHVITVKEGLQGPLAE